MNFLELQDSVLERFESSFREDAKRWLNLFYGTVWGLERWTFREAEAYVTVTSGSSAVTDLPLDVGPIDDFLDIYGEPLVALPRRQWNRNYRYMVLNGQTGWPEAYTVVNGAISVGPPSNTTSSSFRLEYWKRLTQLVDDDDEAQTPDEFDWLLVAGAMQIGQGHTQDPTAVFQDEAIARGIESLRRDFLSDIRTEEQWGKLRAGW